MPPKPRSFGVARQHQIPKVPVHAGTDNILPVTSVRNLGIYIDSDMSMKTHVSKVVSAAFAALRQIRSVRRSLPRHAVVSLVVAIVLTRLDYGNATLAGLPINLLDRLQSVLNASARLICSARKYDHVTPLLCDLHWLRVPERINFKLSVLVFRCLHGLAPSYLADSLHRAEDYDSGHGLRSASTNELIMPATHRTTLGDRSFPVAAARAWNRLPSHVTDLDSLSSFRRAFKTVL